MINPTFKQWLSFVAVIQETVPHVPRMNCQNCTSESVSYEYRFMQEKKKWPISQISRRFPHNTGG